MTDSTPDGWTLTYHGWNPDEQPLREALCTLGSGYFATRGAFEEARAGGPHYPGTYLSGGYNRLESEVAGRIVENEDLVNWPNWLRLTFRRDGGDWFDLDAVEVLEFEQTLDVRRGMLERRVRFRHEGSESRLAVRRFVSMDAPHLAGIEWTLTPVDWSGPLEIETALDGTVINAGVARYRELNSRHLDPRGTGRAGEDGIWLAVQTSQSQVRMAQAARTRVFDGDEPAAAERTTIEEPGFVCQRLVVACRRQKPLRIEKIVAVYTCRDHAISEPVLEARQAVQRAESFGGLLAAHERSWSHLWNRCDIELGETRSPEEGVAPEGPDGQKVGPARRRAQFVLRLHIFHLLQTCSWNSIDRDAGVPARGLHGEAYRGHIFWDELFIFPFLNLRLPELTRSLLMYRYQRLPEARQAARAAGCAGAMFPWQSGSNGREETQVMHVNPRSGRWVPDETHRQRHVNAAIAYNVWQYYQATADTEFLAFYGAELFVEIARFWASLAVWNPERRRYEIRGVVGPDEFHTHMPPRTDLPSSRTGGTDESDETAAEGNAVNAGGTEAPPPEHGLRNNAYTNVMAAWVLRRALDVLEYLPQESRQELADKLQLADEELIRWDDVRRRMFVPFHGVDPEGGPGGQNSADGAGATPCVISQFEGYETLEEFDWEGYRKKYGDIHRLDRILEAEGDSPHRYKAGKQADVLMLFYLFSAEELEQLFEPMGYPFHHEIIPRTIDYYRHRTSHGSTLSGVVHAWVLARSDREGAWGLFERALESDIADIQGGTTSEGIHLGAMAGTVDLVQRCFTGIEVREDVLWLNPRLPDGLPDVRLRLRYRGHWYRLHVTHEALSVSVESGPSHPARIGLRDEVHTIDQGETREFRL